MKLEYPWHHLLSFIVNQLKYLLILKWHLVKSTLEFNPLSHYATFTGTDEVEIILFQIILRPKDNYLVPQSQMLNLIRISTICCFVYCTLGLICAWR